MQSGLSDLTSLMGPHHVLAITGPGSGVAVNQQVTNNPDFLSRN